MFMINKFRSFVRWTFHFLNIYLIVFWSSISSSWLKNAMTRFKRKITKSSKKYVFITSFYHERMLITRSFSRNRMLWWKMNQMKTSNNDWVSQFWRIKNVKKKRQIESDVEKKRKSKKQYYQKLKTIRDRARMIRYSNEKKIIARVKNVDRAAWHYVLIKLKNIEKYKQMIRTEREKIETNAKKNLKAKRFRDEVFDILFSHEFLSRIDEAC